ncbi:hypothetical protein [Streptomyces sulphureus]|uniref:hypothetical protein n=1 Tax=Streptomyces sulphureus TaxID=47758 RepID=UPI00037598FC|nr:hypothetical protein [Streptomyces sulphureus]
MPWARFDDRFPSHRKVRLLSDAAFRLYVSAICWSAENLTDGVITTRELRLVSDVKSARKRAEELVESGLWEVVPETGWRIHDYHEYQPTTAQVQADRKAKTARQQRWREKKKGTEAPPDPPPNTPDVDASTDPSRDAPGDAAPRARVPGPARPDPNPPMGGEGVCAPTGSTGRGHETAHTPVPPNFQPSNDSTAWADREGHTQRLGGPDGLARVTAAFTDWHTAKGTRAADPDALWRKWVRDQRAPLPSQEPPLPAGADVVPLRDRRQQATNDLFGRAMQRAQTRMQQES